MGTLSNLYTVRRRAERLLAQGLCVHCGKQPHRKGIKSCDDCIRKKKQSYFRRYS